MVYIRFLAFLSLTLALLALSGGCGFHLRGNFPHKNALRTVYLSTPEPYSDFTRLLQNTLSQSGIQLTQHPADAQLMIALLSTHLHYPSPNNYYGVQSRIYTFTYQVNYKLTAPNKNKRFAKLYTISAVRNITIKRNEAIGSTPQLPIITQEMQREVAERLLSRLSSLQSHSITKPEINR